MSWQDSVAKALRELQKEEKLLEKQLSSLRTRIKELERLGTAPGNQGVEKAPRLSPKGRAAISKAAKKRWAAYRREQGRAR